jgi:hypothetical protein
MLQEDLLFSVTMFLVILLALLESHAVLRGCGHRNGKRPA